MSNNQMTFLEALDMKIESLDARLSELIEEQKQNFKALLATSTKVDFMFINQISCVAQRDDQIVYLHNSIVKLKDLKTLKIEGGKRKKLFNGELSNTITPIYEDLKANNGEWLKEKKCTIEQMKELYRSIYNKDKKLFFETLLIITDNKSLTDRYTKLLFNTSLKHKSKIQINS